MSVSVFLSLPSPSPPPLQLHVCMYVCVCVYVCVHQYAYMPERVEVRGLSGVFLYHASPYFLRKGLSRNLDLIV